MVEVPEEQAIEQRSQGVGTIPTRYGNLNVADTKSMLSSKRIINNIILKLRGKTFDIAQRKYLQRSAPLLNKEGIGEIRIILESVLNQNTYLSNLTNKEIYDIMISTSQTINTMFCYYKEYGIKKRNFDTIRNAILPPLFCALKRPYNQGEREFIKGTEKREERVIIQDKPAERGILRGLRRR